MANGEWRTFVIRHFPISPPPAFGGYFSAISLSFTVRPSAALLSAAAMTRCELNASPKLVSGMSLPSSSASKNA